MAKSKEPPKKVQKPAKGKAQPAENTQVSKDKPAPKKSKAAPKEVETASPLKISRSKKEADDSHDPLTANVKEEVVGIDSDKDDIDALYASLLPRHQLFIEEYLVDFNATKAAIRTGYTPLSAHNTGCLILKRPEVAKIVEARKEDRLARPRMTVDKLVGEYENMVEADFNELVEFRRVNCRHCWGIGFKFQYNAVEMEERREDYDRQAIQAAAEEKEIAPFDERGGIGYLPNKDPNPECPVCAGEGKGEVFFKDTRNLSRRARAIYAGAEVGKDGIKVKGHSKEKAMEVIAKALKLFEDKAVDINVNTIVEKDLDAMYESKLEKALERAEAALARAERLASKS